MIFLFDVQNAKLTKISQKEKRKTLFNSREGCFPLLQVVSLVFSQGTFG